MKRTISNRASVLASRSSSVGFEKALAVPFPSPLPPSQFKRRKQRRAYEDEEQSDFPTSAPTSDEEKHSPVPGESSPEDPGNGPSKPSQAIPSDVSLSPFGFDSAFDRQRLCAIASDLYIARSLRDLPSPSVAWTETRWAIWRSHEFSYVVVIQRQPATQPRFGPVDLAYREELHGVELLFVTLPTTAIVGMHDDLLRGLTPRVRLSDTQIDVALEFLTEALFSEADDEAGRAHRVRWGDMRPRALVLSGEGLEREAAAVVLAFLASAGTDSARELDAVLSGRDDVWRGWKGLLSRSDLARMEGLAATWRADRMEYFSLEPPSEGGRQPLSSRGESPPPRVASAPAIGPCESPGPREHQSPAYT